MVVRYIVTFEVDAEDEEPVRTALLAAGWRDWIENRHTRGEKLRLPRSTFCAAFADGTTVSVALDQFRIVLENETLFFDRAIVTEAGDARVVSDYAWDPDDEEWWVHVEE